eukprot:301713-Prymnesium_polylepis.1
MAPGSTYNASEACGGVAAIAACSCVSVATVLKPTGPGISGGIGGGGGTSGGAGGCAGSGGGLASATHSADASLQGTAQVTGHEQMSSWILAGVSTGAHPRRHTKPTHS